MTNTNEVDDWYKNKTYGNKLFSKDTYIAPIPLVPRWDKSGFFSSVITMYSSICILVKELAKSKYDGDIIARMIANKCTKDFNSLNYIKAIANIIDEFKNNPERIFKPEQRIDYMCKFVEHIYKNYISKNNMFSIGYSTLAHGPTNMIVQDITGISHKIDVTSLAYIIGYTQVNLYGELNPSDNINIEGENIALDDNNDKTTIINNRIYRIISINNKIRIYEHSTESSFFCYFPRHNIIIGDPQQIYSYGDLIKHYTDESDINKQYINDIKYIDTNIINNSDGTLSVLKPYMRIIKNPIEWKNKIGKDMYVIMENIYKTHGIKEINELIGHYITYKYVATYCMGYSPDQTLINFTKEIVNKKYVDFVEELSDIPENTMIYGEEISDEKISDELGNRTLGSILKAKDLKTILDKVKTSIDFIEYTKEITPFDDVKAHIDFYPNVLSVCGYDVEISSIFISHISTE